MVNGPWRLLGIGRESIERGWVAVDVLKARNRAELKVPGSALSAPDASSAPGPLDRAADGRTIEREQLWVRRVRTTAAREGRARRAKCDRDGLEQMQRTSGLNPTSHADEASAD